VKTGRALAVVALTAGFVLFAHAGCVTETETEDIDEAEDIAEAEDALQPHDRQVGPAATQPDPSCIRACRDAFYACLGSCKYWPPDEQPQCRKLCMDAFFNCESMCNAGNGQGSCLDSHDCNGLPGWSNP